MFRAMFSPIISSTWIYLQLMVVFTQVAAGCCHGWVGTRSFNSSICPYHSHPKRPSAQVLRDSNQAAQDNCILWSLNWKWLKFWTLGTRRVKGQPTGRVQLKRDGTLSRTEGEMKGKWRMEWVASTLHTTSEHGASSITTADAHNLAASSRLNWRPCRYKWTRPFRRKAKCGFCACAIAFQTQPTILCLNQFHALWLWLCSRAPTLFS